MPASQGNRSGRIARFGVFELDLAAGELRKSGAKLRLQEQPFQVLAMLLERAGDVVTREELRQKLWPADTFVDFDHSLNTAVNKLRETLGDSASSPRYIETLARRGYRFIAPVQNSVETGALARPAERSSAATTFAQDSPNALHPELEVPDPAARAHARIVCSGTSDVSDLLCGRAVSSACGAGHRRFFFAGMDRDRACGDGDGDRGSWHSASLLSALRGGIRLPAPGREIPADVSFHSGAGSDSGPSLHFC